MEVVVVKRRRHIAASVFGGLFLGMGASIMLTIYGVVGWGTVWPNVILALGVALGVVVGLIPASSPKAAGPLTDAPGDAVPPAA
jgi:hypothetical protein